MSDRLTQLQICLDQLVEQFCATLNYVDKSHDLLPAENEEKLIDTTREIPSNDEFKSTINELSTDLILKTRQILTLIESLPGANVSQTEQLLKIQNLQRELLNVEQEKIDQTKKKDELQKFVNQLILEFSKDLINSK
ncbi:hypothetical protein WICMUC_002099 [Wickerhamomyces mucosus]|uniref:Mediator of RNA polymerase II transcription subunit 21 n=1 Tax=Wickerhamomyces mucosus TaxID=1378264 RepID=A0A9P8PQ17_9ASCO|nr:hypothetical protein WICMUC_002099 [Wickerhamomyces mucosus]